MILFLIIFIVGLIFCSQFNESLNKGNDTLFDSSLPVGTYLFFPLGFITVPVVIISLFLFKGIIRPFKLIFEPLKKVLTLIN